MSDNFNQQKDVLLSIKREISLLHQQVDYLIRNEKPLGLLDLDVLMNRTHTLYDQLCSIDLGGAPVEDDPVGDDEELPVGLDEIRSIFGIEEEQPKEESQAPAEEEEEDEYDEKTEELLDAPEEEEEIEKEQEEVSEDITEGVEEELPEETPEDPSEELPADDEDAYFIDEPDDETPEETPTENYHSDDFGFILNFEPADPEPEKEPEPEPEPELEFKSENSVFTTGDEIEMTIPHTDLPQEEIPTDEVPQTDAPYEEVYEPVVIGEMEKQDDDEGFEFERPETLADHYQQHQEETVGEKLQRSTVGDLQKAIGINDKFLFVNELFGGSMEKYNRSIENINDLKTLNGALIYLNELRVELQWNSNNEAYKKLLELVHRKFEA